MNSSLISVVVPMHKIQKDFSKVRQRLHLAKTPIEIIYVIDEKIGNDILPTTTSNEKVIRIPNIGRGYMLRKGASCVKGDVIMFLHSDTLLPKNWDVIVRRAMQDKKVVGGGFSLQFDTDSLYLTLALKITTILVKSRKVLSGDRAIFLKTEVFKKDIPDLEVPIMEDIRLSYWMRKHGKVILLKEPVITSSEAFVRNGVLRHTWKIIKCMLWYRVGGDLQKIYNYYYS